MGQNYGLSNEVRELFDDLSDEWEDANEDHTVCRIEARRITRYITRLQPLVYQMDDAVRLSASLLHIGPADAGKRNKGRIRDFERVHGPVKIDEYRRIRKRPADGTPPDAA